MSNQNRFLLPASSSSSISNASKANNQESASSALASTKDDQENQLSVDTDFDSYWEEEARNPHRNRIRIGRQYQATVPGLLKAGEKEFPDRRKLEDLETLSFCPKRSAKISNAELDHYFTVAKSLSLFASLVETRSLLGRDVTIADLNHIRRKEGLSLASVIQPARQAASTLSAISNTSASPQSSQQQSVNIATTASQQQSPQKSPLNSDKQPTSTLSSVATSPREASLNQPLMKALSHFISLHHPCHHDTNCKKLQKDIPFENDTRPAVSITAGNLRQGSSSSKDQQPKTSRSRSSVKAQLAAKQEDLQEKQDQQDIEQQQQTGDNVQSPSIEDWTREEIELFSKAIEVCGKNFSSIKKDFLPSKSVKSIVEYYYIGSRDISDNKKKSNQIIDQPSGDTCSSPEKLLANNNGQGGGGGGPSIMGKNGTNPGQISASSTHHSSSSSRNPTGTTDSVDNPGKSPVEQTSREADHQASDTQVKIEHNLAKQQAQTKPATTHTTNNTNGVPTKNIDARMSVYNFDDEFKDETPAQMDCPKSGGAEVRPLKAKPIIPNVAAESDNNNSNVGSLKFFMDGQLVLKLNACQDQQEGAEKCHWVQSGDRHVSASRQKRYTKRSEKNPDANLNGSQSNSVVSSYQDDDSKNDDLSGDEDSKESMNSFTNSSAQVKASNQPNSPNSKRLKTTGDPNLTHNQLPSPVDYNRLALNNRIKDRSDSIRPNSAISQAMPWLQANSFAMAAALLGGLPFPPSASMIQETQNINNNTSISAMNSKPMDLSVEHHQSPSKASPKSTSRSRGRSKNNN